MRNEAQLPRKTNRAWMVGLTLALFGTVSAQAYDPLQGAVIPADKLITREQWQSESEDQQLGGMDIFLQGMYEMGCKIGTTPEELARGVSLMYMRSSTANLSVWQVIAILNAKGEYYDCPNKP